MRIASTLCSLLFGLALTSSEQSCTAASIVADSIVEFSGEQGKAGWHYGFYDGDAPAPFAPGDFEPFPLYDGTRWLIKDGVGGYWTELTAREAHPNGSTTSGGRLGANHWAVRRWVSDSDGVHAINGILADVSDYPAQLSSVNGVIGHVFVDGVELLKLPIRDGEQTTYSFYAHLSVGSIVDFALDARPISAASSATVDHSDWTTFTAQVIKAPEPSTAWSCAVVLIFAPAVVRRVAGGGRG